MNSPEKGKRVEREVAKLCRSLGFRGSRRGRQYAGHPESPDIFLCEGVHVEVKGTQRFNYLPVMEKLDKECGNGDIPLILHKYNRQIVRAIFNWQDVWDLYNALDAVKIFNRMDAANENGFGFKL